MSVTIRRHHYQPCLSRLVTPPFNQVDDDPSQNGSIKHRNGTAAVHFLLLILLLKVSEMDKFVFIPMSLTLFFLFLAISVQHGQTCVTSTADGGPRKVVNYDDDADEMNGEIKDKEEFGADDDDDDGDFGDDELEELSFDNGGGKGQEFEALDLSKEIEDEIAQVDEEIKEENTIA